ncbi:MAG: HyaD/HybD family hydrogenase maturation endopeptidase [Gammaproteobacteria bacterium]|nr:HyaD/HybD family hydrogenase maturation endopeptidase [Gammaproteobacteria bacterium]
MKQNVLVLGLGNTLLSDEGAGIHVIRYLQEQFPDRPNVEYLDGGTLSFTLSEPIENADALIVVDAAELGTEAGVVRCYQDKAMDDFVGGNRKRSVHEVSLIDLLAVAYLTERLPKRRALVGIQPASVDWGDQPTQKVADAIPTAGRQILDLIEAWHQ